MDELETIDLTLEHVVISGDFIKLSSFLKYCGAVMTGGEAKQLVLSGQVMVNELFCAERGRKLRPGDIVSVGGRRFLVDNIHEA